ncbi:Arylsulfatase [Pontiella desulfatans]|uniref:Arylsulfatase n=1 Tax=Pontiella desulfatans TaxID=2750659 RepID=A0A6C2U8B1_PONDE|nr:sulfatase-like hydrolase/transferase [Pontiella desulfatans]SPS74022.1 sulfatase S1_23 [Kiritimatiellales bacterium]VGO16290.1 Arylsulfatase [Pontiella desulfatans]
MKKPLFILGLVVIAGISNAQIIKILGRKPNASTAPNIIMMMADDMGPGDVGYYGWNDKMEDPVLTPHLDAMASSGLRFDRFYAQSPVCSPTRGSCISGRHAFRYGIWEANQGGGRVEEITLPDVLKKHAGYTTGHFGKWHLGRMVPHQDWGQATRMDHYTPGMAGFDEWFSVTHSVKTYDPYGPAGVDDPPEMDSDYNPYYHNGVEYTDPLFGDTSEIIMDRAIPFMDRAVSQGKPFMACIWFHTPHKDLDASAADQALYPSGSDGEKKYYGSITAMDRQIGRLRTWLRAKGIENNTILWFTTDNGQTTGSSGPYLASKRHLFDGGIRVPTVLEWPAKVPANRTTGFLASTSDYFLTHLDAAGIDYVDPHPRDGISLVPCIEGAMSARANSIAFQSHDTSVIMSQAFKAMKVRPGAYSDGFTERQGFPIDEWLLFDMTLTNQYLIERENISAGNATVLFSLTTEYDLWNLSCSNSYHGADYDAPFTASGDYKGLASDD